MKNILVIGSANMDLVIHTNRLPNLGETVSGFGFTTNFGGKGINQAISASRLGGNVKMICSVGSDSYGTGIIKLLRDNAVGTSGLTTADSPTGIAVITVCNSDNHIILDMGANAYLTPEAIDKHADLFEWADIAVFQLEIPVETVEYSIKLAKKHNVFVVLNPSPVKPFDKSILPFVDVIIPNEYEAEQITGIVLDSPQAEAAAASALVQLGAKNVIITFGEHGSAFSNGTGIMRQKAYKVKSVDTTAAGDTFIGAFCVGLCEEMNITEVMSYASAAAAFTVTRLGAVSALPYKAEVEDFMKLNK